MEEEGERVNKIYEKDLGKREWREREGGREKERKRDWLKSDFHERDRKELILCSEAKHAAFPKTQN